MCTPGTLVSNTGQVVAELKVVTSNKLCEPNASNCPNAPRHKHKERKHPRKKARTPKLLKLHEDAQRQSVEREGEDEGVDEGVDAAGEQGEARRRGAPLAGTANSSPVETPSGSPATSCGRV